jgi:UDP-N-acetylglucosamine 4-epimerase
MTKHHKTDLKGKSFLITGGAGFIGSHIVDYMISNGAIVRVLDDLSNGYYVNIEHHVGNPNFEFVEGDIRDIDTCDKAVLGMQYVCHQAALGSVPRSIETPLVTNAVNISGFLNMLDAARRCDSVSRFVYAASSSTFGDDPRLPKVEGNEGSPLSPYAVTKAVNEYYADVYSKVYGFHSVGLRYFNIFGPRQNPDNPYAAVIPIFCKAFLDGVPPTINGDGITSRDFTYVENAVQANILALLSETIEKSEVFNVACNAQVSLNDMVSVLGEISGNSMTANYAAERAGDVKHSMASIAKIESALDYKPEVQFRDGLEKVYQWYKKYYNIE